jgi:hypothetical protein
MDSREQFFTDEFFRYSAECRRLARLARARRREPDRGVRHAWAPLFIERLGEHIVQPLFRPAYRLIPQPVLSHR